MWRTACIYARIQNLGLMQLEATSQTMRLRIENASSGYDLMILNLIAECPGPLARGSSDVCNLCPGGECLTPRFEFMSLDFRKPWPTCSRRFWFLKRVPWTRMLRTMIPDNYSNIKFLTIQSRECCVNAFIYLKKYEALGEANTQMMFQVVTTLHVTKPLLWACQWSQT